MLDKLYKASVILIATVLLVVSLVVLLKPDTLLAQKTTPTSSLPNSSMYAIPESHEWDAIASNSHERFFPTVYIFNKRTGETWQSENGEWGKPDSHARRIIAPQE
jgi:hypothetical protein